KERGILVRYFDKERINNYIRITIGTEEQMDILLKELKKIVEGWIG
ncbi:MAG: histidinol-phosphate transaminase, partial [Clostridiaceae bacterium]